MPLMVLVNNFLL